MRLKIMCGVGAHGHAPLRIRVEEIPALLIILLLAGVLRLGWPGVNSFAFDEAHLSLLALEMARGGQLARVGMPSSVGVPNLPGAVWIFSLPYLLSPDPLAASQFAGLLGLLLVAGTWALARRTWGRWAGLTAALFLAAHPYGVLYSRSVWAQNLLPALGLAWAWTAYLSITRRSRLAMGLHVFLAGFAMQVHFAGAALILPTAYFFVRFRWWRPIVPVLIGGAVALLALLPFVGEVACCRPDIAEQFRTVLGGSAQIDLAGFGQLAQMALGLDWGYLLLGDLQPPDVWALAAVAGIVLAAGIITMGLIVVRAQRAAPLQGKTFPVDAGLPVPSSARSESAALAEIVLAWLMASPLFFARHSTPVWIHYHLAALPALALLAGAGMGWMSIGVGDDLRPSPTTTDEWRPHAAPLHALPGRLLPTIPALLVVLLAFVWATQLAQGFDRAGRDETPNGLGTPLAYTRQAAHSLPADVPMLFFTHGDDPNVDGEAAVFAALWWGRDYRIVQGESLLILPDQPAYLMATLRALQAWEEIDDAGLAVDVQRFARREGADAFVATFYDGTTEPVGFTRLDAPVRLGDGAQLEGWKARRVGPRLRISTLWRALETPAPGIYQQFHHLRTADVLDSEQPLAVSDVTISAHRWQADDRLIVMGDFFVDEVGPFWVDVGHYTLPDGQRIPRADGREGVVRLGPFEMATDS